MAIPLTGLSRKLPAFLGDCSFPCDVTGPGTMQIVMLRGCRATDKDLRVRKYIVDRYCDLLVVFGRKQATAEDPDGAEFLWCADASARPGDRSTHDPGYTSNRGCPTMQPGQYLYQRGMHNTKSGSYEAMRQAGHVVVIRDGDDDHMVDPDEAMRPDYDASGINIHAGGTSETVGIWSMGCQIIQGGRGAGSPWRTFHDLVYRVCAGQKLWRYTLVDYSMFCEWHDAQPGATPKWLLYGSVGQRVKGMQNRLIEHGWLHANHVTGKFDPDTDLAVRRMQRHDGMAVPTGTARL